MVDNQLRVRMQRRWTEKVGTNGLRGGGCAHMLSVTGTVWGTAVEMTLETGCITTQHNNTTTSSFEWSGSLTLLKDAPSLHSPLSLSCRVSSLNTLRPAWGVKAFKHKHKPDTQTQPCSHRSALQETKAGARMKCSHCHHPNTSAKITDLRSCVKHSPQREFTKKP